MKKVKPKCKRRDPLMNISYIEHVPDEEIDDDLSDVTPFEDIKDSGAHIRELRKNAWRK